ncbi:hypothetical protein LZ554_002759 [Drepanopeziza brunnea f. sp. 'monogermtubi']|nr:hypothetical protein LZ554_002759 [Drepanopeziza brunnea f. sp. 'monogermtubi']
MDDTSMPQDEYFEWEDIVLYRAPGEVTESGETVPCHHHHQTLEYRRTYSQTCEASDSEPEDFQWNDGMSATLTTSVQTSFTLNWNSGKKDTSIDFPSYDDDDDDDDDDNDDDDIHHGLGLAGLEHATPIVEDYPISGDAGTIETVKPDATVTDASGASSMPECRDSSSISLQPFGNVNYLLHQWREEDVSASWRHLVTKSRTWAEAEKKLDHASWKRHNAVARLENASWRTWSKLRFGCKTVSPQTINWSKNCDDTCLLGPFFPGTITTTSSPSVSHQSPDIRTPKSKSNPCAASPTPILKKPSMAEILCRGSLPTFTANQAVVQGRSLSDASPLSYHQTSSQHVEFSSPIPTLAPRSTRTKSVKFLEEVRQYVIVLPIGDGKIHRTVKKTRSATLKSAEAYSLDPTPAPTPAPEPSDWSPENPWSCNAESSQPETVDLEEWSWLGGSGEEEDAQDYSAPIFTSSPEQHGGPSSSDTAFLPPDNVGTGPLTQFNLSSFVMNTTDADDDDDDELDYLSGFTSRRRSNNLGSASSFSSSSASDTQYSEDSSGDDEDLPPSPPMKETMPSSCFGEQQQKYLFPGAGMTSVDVVDDDDDHQRTLYEQIMEEFELGF